MVESEIIPVWEDVRFDLWLKSSFGFKIRELLKAFEFYHLWETVHLLRNEVIEI